MRRSRAFSAVLGCVFLIAVLAIAGCSSGATTGTTGTKTIIEKGFAFNPTSLSVNVGDVVTFLNEDSVPHHVVVGTDDLGVQPPGQSLSWTAGTAGTIGVKCLIHPSMTAQITVGAGGPNVPASGGTGGGSPAPSTGGGYGY
jgi:plastocyanin